MRTTHTATAVNIAKATNLSAFMINTFLQHSAEHPELDDTSKRDEAERMARAERGTPVRSGFRCCALMLSWGSFALGCDDADHEFDYVARAERYSTQP